MEQTSPNEQKEESQEVVLKPDSKKKKGLLEFVSVIILLILTLGILNYLNIIPLSSTFPFLGFLPRNQFMQTQDQISTTAKPTLLPEMTADLSSTQKETEALFIEILSNTIYKHLMPEKSKITTALNKNSKVLTSTWEVNGVPGTGIFSPTPDNKGISEINLLFSDNRTSLSKETAPRITSSYFSFKPKGVWECNLMSGTNMNYCENFWEESDGTKKGIGVQQLSENDATVFFCQYSKESAQYAWKSCSPQFAQEGVK